MDTNINDRKVVDGSTVGTVLPNPFEDEFDSTCRGYFGTAKAGEIKQLRKIISRAELVIRMPPAEFEQKYASLYQ